MRSAKHIQVAFGRALREARVAAGLSQERLGQRAGIHRTYVGDVERGERNLGLVNMQRLADALSVDLGQIVARMQRHLLRGR